MSISKPIIEKLFYVPPPSHVVKDSTLEVTNINVQLIFYNNKGRLIL